MNNNTKGIILMVLLLLILIILLCNTCIRIKGKATYQWDHKQFEEHVKNRQFVYER